MRIRLVRRNKFNINEYKGKAMIITFSIFAPMINTSLDVGKLDAAKFLQNINAQNYHQMSKYLEQISIQNIPTANISFFQQLSRAQRELNTQNSDEKTKFIDYLLPIYDQNQRVETAVIEPHKLKEGEIQELVSSYIDSEKDLIYHHRLFRNYVNLSDFKIVGNDDSLHFTAHFESGNLYSAQREKGKQTYYLLMNPDTGSASHCQWFNFIAFNIKEGTRYKIIIQNFVKKQSSYQFGMNVLGYDLQNQELNFIGQNVSYIANKNYIDQDDALYGYYSLVFDFIGRSSSPIHIFQTYPYTNSQCQYYINLHKFNIVKIGTTLLNSALNVIQIGNKDANDVIVVSARIHPGEVQSSYIVEGLLDQLLYQELNKTLNQNILYIIMPMLNPEGSILGNYRCNNAGVDLNRHWHSRGSIAPCIDALFNYMEGIKKQGKQILSFIDLHGHFGKKNSFGYACKDDGFFAYLGQKSHIFQYKQCKFGISRGKRHTGRVVCFSELGIEHSYCIETSFYGYTDKYDSKNKYLTIKDYKQLGSDIAQCMDFFHVNKEDVSGFLKQVGIDFVMPVEPQSTRLFKLEQQRAKQTTKSDALSSDYEIISTMEESEQSDSDEDVQLPGICGNNSDFFEKVINSQIGAGALTGNQEPKEEEDKAQKKVKKGTKKQKKKTRALGDIFNGPKRQDMPQPPQRPRTQLSHTPVKPAPSFKRHEQTIIRASSSMSSASTKSCSAKAPLQAKVGFEPQNVEQKKSRPRTAHLVTGGPSQLLNQVFLEGVEQNSQQQAQQPFARNLALFKRTTSKKAPQGQVRIVYESKMNLEREKQRFDYDFYQDDNAIREFMREHVRRQYQKAGSVSRPFLMFGKDRR